MRVDVDHAAGEVLLAVPVELDVGDLLLVAHGLDVGGDRGIGGTEDSHNAFEEKTTEALGHFEDTETGHEDGGAREVLLGTPEGVGEVDAQIEGVVEVRLLAVEDCT